MKKEAIAVKRTPIALVSILTIAPAGAVSASAEPIAKRLHRQKLRIHHGVDRSGQNR